MGLYTSENDVNLLRDIMLQSGKIKGREYFMEGKGTVGTPGVSCVITLTNPPTFAEDALNGYKLYIVDDDSDLCIVDIDDSVANTSITVDTTATKEVSDETTAGTFTASTEYDLYILKDEKFLGYSDQQLDYEEETIDFNTGDIPRKRVRSDTLGIILGFSGNLRNFGADLFSEIFGLTSYGSQTNKKQYHGGNTPAVRSDWQLTMEMKNVKGHDWTVQFFKGQFFSNGALNTSEEGYKIAPYMFKSFIDTLRDSDNVNQWRIIQNTQ